MRAAKSVARLRLKFFLFEKDFEKGIAFLCWKAGHGVFVVVSLWEGQESLFIFHILYFKTFLSTNHLL